VWVAESRRPTNAFRFVKRLCCKVKALPGENKLKPETCSLTPHCAMYPPSTERIAPVTNEASSEARKRMAFATSAGSPSLPTG
jgi:hypothetical protein